MDRRGSHRSRVGTKFCVEGSRGSAEARRCLDRRAHVGAHRSRGRCVLSLVGRRELTSNRFARCRGGPLGRSDRDDGPGTSRAGENFGSGRAGAKRRFRRAFCGSGATRPRGERSPPCRDACRQRYGSRGRGTRGHLHDALGRRAPGLLGRQSYRPLSRRHSGALRQARDPRGGQRDSPDRRHPLRRLHSSQSEMAGPLGRSPSSLKNSQKWSAQTAPPFSVG